MASKTPPPPKYTGLVVVLPCINGRPRCKALLMVDSYGTLYVPNETGPNRTYMAVSEVVSRFGPVVIESTTKAR